MSERGEIDGKVRGRKETASGRERKIEGKGKLLISPRNETAFRFHFTIRTFDSAPVIFLLAPRSPVRRRRPTAAAAPVCP